MDRAAARRGLVTAMVAGGVLASAGCAPADAAGARAAGSPARAAGSPGLTSGSGARTPQGVAGRTLVPAPAFADDAANGGAANGGPATPPPPSHLPVPAPPNEPNSPGRPTPPIGPPLPTGRPRRRRPPPPPPTPAARTGVGAHRVLRSGLGRCGGRARPAGRFGALPPGPRRRPPLKLRPERAPAPPAPPRTSRGKQPGAPRHSASKVFARTRAPACFSAEARLARRRDTPPPPCRTTAKT